MKPWSLLWALALVLGLTALAQDAPPKDAAKPAAAEPATAELKVPAGFKAAEGTAAEPYTKTGWAKEIVHEATGITMVYIPAGEFVMGSPKDEKSRNGDETQHRVTLTKGFYLGKSLVTQAQWEAVMGKNPSIFQEAGKEAPVEKVSWDDGQAFCQKLGAGFRLPTEAEWEYACRAGTTTAFCGGDDRSRLADYAWYYENSGDARLQDASWSLDQLTSNHCQTHPVGQKKPNAWGLYDMHGNVGQWCSDWYGAYPSGAVTDPTGPETGSKRVHRGGGYLSLARLCRSASRGKLDPGHRGGSLGLRLAFSLLADQR